MRQGQVWQFERDRPSTEDDPRTPYRVVGSADYRLPPERRWVLTAPIVSTLDVDTPVAVRLQPGDPVKGFIRADEVTRTYVPWLTGPAGMITVATTRPARRLRGADVLLGGSVGTWPGSSS